MRTCFLVCSSVTIGFVTASVLQGLLSPHRAMPARLRSSTYAAAAGPTVEAEHLEQAAEENSTLIPEHSATPPPRQRRDDPIGQDRPLWEGISTAVVYPAVNDAQASFRAVNESLLALGMCHSDGSPINWGLNDNFEALLSNHSSLRFSSRPEAPRQPYRGHVKACMYENHGYFWQGYWKVYGQCKGEEYCDLPCGDVHCRFAWSNFDGCTAAIMHHHLDSIAGDAPHLRKIVSITEPYYKPEVEAILAVHRRAERRTIDIVAHWHRSANIFYPAHNNQFSPGGEEEFAKAPNFAVMACPPRAEVLTKTSAERRIALAVFNNGNCNTAGGYRERYVRELRQHIHVDAYGPCLHSKDRPPIPADDHWRYEHETEVRSHYKFFLAFENQISDDWVTERVFSGLAAGTVPVYHGASNVQDFLPCSNCVIEANRFKGPAELAKYLIYLDQNPDRYAEYHAWRAGPLRIPQVLLTSKAFWYCGACQAVADDIEGKLAHVQWDAAEQQWVPDPGRARKPVPPTWLRGFD